MENNANTLSEKNVANNSSSIPVVPAQYKVFLLTSILFCSLGLIKQYDR